MAYFGCVWWSIRGARSNGNPLLLWNKAPEEVAQLGEGLWCRLACIYMAGQRPRNAQAGWRNSPKCLCSARRREPGFFSLLSPALHFCCPIRVALAEIHSLAQEEASAFPPSILLLLFLGMQQPKAGGNVFCCLLQHPCFLWLNTNHPSSFFYLLVALSLLYIKQKFPRWSVEVGRVMDWAATNCEHVCSSSHKTRAARQPQKNPSLWRGRGGHSSDHWHGSWQCQCDARCYLQ